MLQITFISHLWERVFEHTVYCNSTYQQISEVYMYVQWYNHAVNDDTIPQTQNVHYNARYLTVL